MRGTLDCLPSGSQVTHSGVGPCGIWLRSACVRLGAPTIPDEPILREKARDAIRSGRLPSRRSDRMWGGPGVSASCAVCGEPVSRDQTGFELQFESDGAEHPMDKHHLHVRCFAAWEFERIVSVAPRDPRPTRYPAS